MEQCEGSEALFGRLRKQPITQRERAGKMTPWL